MVPVLQSPLQKGEKTSRRTELSKMYPQLAASGLLLFIFPSVLCFPGGPPGYTCMTMLPGHGRDLTWQESGPCPYSIKLSTPIYQPAQVVTITLEADDGTPIKGIQVSVHRKDLNTEEFQGKFIHYLPQDKLQAMNCMGGLRNQIGHKNAKNAGKIVLAWKAPDVNIGDVIVKVTFVKSYSEYWVSQRAELKTYNASSVVKPDHIVETPQLGMEDIDFTLCGQRKGCFLYPRHCSGPDCDAALTFKRNNDTYTIEMMSRSHPFLTMGLSKDKKMGNDHTITCTVQGNHASIQNGINPGYYNERVLAKNLTDIRVESTSSHVMCRFTRPRVVSVLRDVPKTDPPEVTFTNFDLEEKWYIMLAWGQVATGTDAISKHMELPIVTDEQVNFQQTLVYRGSFLAKEYKTHGALMVTAWIFLAGLATLIPRHYKHMAGRRLLAGAQIWFQSHRAIGSLILIFTAISFIVIFDKVGGLSGPAARGHAWVGIAVGVIVLLQTVAGVFRPAPDSKIRPLFRWGHRLQGKVVHILAAVALYLAFNFAYTNEAMRRFGSNVVMVWIFVQIIWELVFEIWSYRRAAKHGDENLVTSSSDMDIIELKPSPTATVDTLLMSLYILSLSIFAIATLCAVFLY